MGNSNKSSADGNIGPEEPARPEKVDPIANDRPTLDDVIRFLKITHPAGHAIEIRAPKTRFPKTTGETNVVKRFAPGEFVKAAKETLRLSGNAPAIYVVMNGVDIALPRSGRLGGGAKAENIPRRLRILFDFDPTRPADTNATDEEKAGAFKRLEIVRADLCGREFPEPVVADSGNGYHLVYAIDLPNDGDATALIKSVLTEVAAKFDTEAVKVDCKVFDAPRLVKLYGTEARKGEDTPERPHRFSRILSAPAELETVSVDQLRQLVAELTSAPAPKLDLDAEIERKRAQAALDDEPPKKRGMTFRNTSRPSAEERAALYLEKCEPAISGQKGHDKAFKTACKVGPGFDLPPETAFRLLWNLYNPRCDPPWTERELRHKVDDAYVKETRRGWLLNAERNGRFQASTNNNGKLKDGQPHTSPSEADVLGPDLSQASLDRVREHIESGVAADLFRDKNLLAGLALLKIEQPAEFAAIKTEIMQIKGMKPRDFNDSIKQYHPRRLFNENGLDQSMPVFAGGWDLEAQSRTVIRVTADIHTAVFDGAIALVKHPDVFTRCGDLARVVRHPGNETDDKKIKRDAGTPVIVPMDADVASVWLSRSSRFQKFDKKSKDWEFTKPTKELAAAVLGLKTYPGGRELVGVIEAPTIRPDGSLLDTPGYDPLTGLLYLPNDIFPAIPNEPTACEVAQALSFLLKIVLDYPFEDDCNRAAWLAYVLTVVARGAIAGPVPLFLFSANVAGIGKTTLAAIAGLIASGRHPAMDGYTHDDIEMEKRLTAMAIAGDRCVILDNAENGARIGGTALDRAVTAKGAFRGRILGSSKMSGRDVPWTAVLSVTGNNIGTRSDMRRRVVPCYLKSSLTKPEERDPESFAIFRETGGDIEKFVIANRPALVTAALTIVRAYIVAGRPKLGLTSIDFPAWSELIRQGVAWAFDYDPAGSRDRLESEDETTSDRVRLVSAWRTLCEAVDLRSPDWEETRKAINRGLTAAEAAAALADMHTNKLRPDVIQAFATFAPKGASTPDATRLGYAVRKEKDAPTECGTLVEATIYRGTRRWVVENWVPPQEDLPAF